MLTLFRNFLETCSGTIPEVEKGLAIGPEMWLLALWPDVLRQVIYSISFSVGWE